MVQIELHNFCSNYGAANMSIVKCKCYVNLLSTKDIFRTRYVMWQLWVVRGLSFVQNTQNRMTFRILGTMSLVIAANSDITRVGGSNPVNGSLYLRCSRVTRFKEEKW